MFFDPLQTQITLSGAASGSGNTVEVGMYVEGTGIPTGTWVVSKPTATQVSGCRQRASLGTFELKMLTCYLPPNLTPKVSCA